LLHTVTNDLIDPVKKDAPQQLSGCTSPNYAELCNAVTTLHNN